MPARALPSLFVVALAVACHAAPPASRAVGANAIPAPAADPDARCADVGTRRICWDAAGTASVVARPVPSAPASTPLGWRCAGPGPSRLCADRAAGAPGFSCAGARCAQRHARRPDDGEWTCVETAGATLCLGSAPPAGVVAGPPDVAWICGARRGPRAARGERVCVDLSPDFPDADMGAWSCRAGNGAVGTRVCERGARAGSLGVTCERARPCVDGAACAEGRCVPARPAPSCWLDEDCAGGACRFGSCRAEGLP
ncbi:MAG TPA: hypothetical protein VLA14_11705 [Polyangia bacterium]|nr:hypothetical protein [Polyangia bacterium]